MTDYPPASWRLLITPPADGAANMAIDEAILHVLADGAGHPTLRFYQWEPACLSLGYNQPWTDVNELACASLGYTWVRRPTGGRAILHTDELTYSIVVPADEPRVSGGVVDSYRRLSAGLLAGLRALGADVFQAQEEKVLNPDQGAVCFDTPSKYEITVRGKKLIGSAQVRRRGMILQHGTLPLTGDLNRIFSCLQLAEPAPAGAGPHHTGFQDLPEYSTRQDRHLGAAIESETDYETPKPWSDWLMARACTLEQVLGREVPFSEAANALAQGFASALNLRLEPGHLTDDERSLAEQLRREQYTSDRWNRRV
ncbi:MAG: lipoate--protein ligase family protein [Anaerolineales bacterium]|nr:MAG: lipoate--protein ligase family protein [Anaerolineales bacterium]